jgi:NADH dehydrogenase/NADH:ubiquinone oxidoreductase subunit G
MNLSIDGKECVADSGQTLLQVARANGVHIPTLCYHKALEARGACRVCLVEISNPKWEGFRKLVASCVYPVEEGLVVKTATEEIVQIRKTLIDLLMARCPDTKEVQALGQEYGLTETTFEKRVDDDQCILCGLCVRVCQDVMGACAIGVSGRGATKIIGPAFGKPAASCIGCGACAHVCPTHCIRLEDAGMTRKIRRWQVEFELVACRRCGQPVSTKEHIEFVRRRVGVGPEVLETCPDCLRKYYGGKVAAEGHM